MKLYINKRVYNVFGKPITMVNGGDAAKLGELIIEALLSDHPNDRNSEAKHKIRLYQNAKAIKKQLDTSASLGSDERSFLELPVEEVAFIKDRCAMFFGPNILGPVFDLIEAQSELKEVEQA